MHAGRNSIQLIMLVSILTSATEVNRDLSCQLLPLHFALVIPHNKSTCML